MNLKSSSAKKIPVCEPLFLGREMEYVQDAVASGWISSSGRYLKEFEEKFSRFCHARHGVSCTSGTAALHLALRAIGIEKDDEVIIPDFTMAAVLFSVLYCSAKPVFIDADPETWNMDVSQIESKINSKTKAIIAVHTYGHPCDMDPLLGLAKKHNLKVVEDAAEAHGALYKGKPCGSLGDIACFSFYANKIITTGEGGMVVTNDPVLADRCRYFKNLCFPLNGARNYQHDEVGYNYRMTNVQAAMGVAQLEHIDQYVERRRKNAAFYNRELKKIKGVQCPPEKDYAKNVFWMYGIVMDPKVLGMTRDHWCQRLSEKGVETRPFFKPMHQQKMIDPSTHSQDKKYPVSIHLAANGFYLPSGSGLTQGDLEFILDAVRTTSQHGA